MVCQTAEENVFDWRAGEQSSENAAPEWTGLDSFMSEASSGTDFSFVAGLEDG
jgi:hypothetical protein